MSPIRVAVAGSTGSIGAQTLDVVRSEGPDRYRVTALGAGSSVEAVVAQAREFHPEIVAMTDPAARDEVRRLLPGVDVVGDLTELVEPADVVVNGVVGFAGLPVTTTTLQRGRRLALANKESLIAAGPVVQPLRSTPGAELVPVDSEHCAIHQCLRSSVGFDGGGPDEVAR
ncbi:MAG: 1-deoxy-D-xylulose-5-phosphate reductoisomerase, partial [Ilumatobacteraceae bacterium]